MINTQLFLMKNRVRKKWKLYKRFFQLSFDLTSLFYVLLVLGYIFVAIVLEGNISQTFNETIIELETITIERFWQIVTIIPLFYLFRAFQQPGVIFSTAEYLLTILPNRHEKVWLITSVSRWLKALTTFLIGGVALLLFSPTSISIIVLYVCLLFFINVLMTIPEWKFFQLPIWRKIAVVLLFITLNIVAIYVPNNMVGISFIILLIVYNIVSAPKLFTNIDWKKVTAASDFKLWNMIIISQATKIKFKKERQYSLWQRLAFWKRPFPYEKQSVYHRLWHLYIEKNLGVIFQIVGALFIMLFVFMIIKNNLFLFSVALTIHIYTSLIASMFQNRLVTDIVEALPWDLFVFKRTLTKWVINLGFIFVIPYIIYVYLYFSYWVFPQLIVIIFTFRLMLRVKLDKVVQSLDQKYETKNWLEAISYGLLIIIMFSSAYPPLLILGCLFVGIMPFFYRKNI